MSIRVRQNERLLVGRLPGNGWRFSVPYVYELHDDSRERVTVPFLGPESGFFEEVRGLSCPPDELPRFRAHRAILARLAAEHGGEAAAESAMTTSWVGDNAGVVSDMVPAPVARGARQPSQMSLFG